MKQKRPTYSGMAVLENSDLLFLSSWVIISLDHLGTRSKYNITLPSALWKSKLSSTRLKHGPKLWPRQPDL